MHRLKSSNFIAILVFLSNIMLAVTLESFDPLCVSQANLLSELENLKQ